MFRKVMWLLAFTALMSERGIVVMPFLCLAFWLDTRSVEPDNAVSAGVEIPPRSTQ